MPEGRSALSFAMPFRSLFHNNDRPGGGGRFVNRPYGGGRSGGAGRRAGAIAPYAVTMSLRSSDRRAWCGNPLLSFGKLPPSPGLRETPGDTPKTLGEGGKAGRRGARGRAPMAKDEAWTRIRGRGQAPPLRRGTRGSGGRRASGGGDNPSVICLAWDRQMTPPLAQGRLTGRRGRRAIRESPLRRGTGVGADRRATARVAPTAGTAVFCEYLPAFCFRVSASFRSCSRRESSAGQNGLLTRRSVEIWRLHFVGFAQKTRRYFGKLRKSGADFFLKSLFAYAIISCRIA